MFSSRQTGTDLVGGVGAFIVIDTPPLVGGPAPEPELTLPISTPVALFSRNDYLAPRDVTQKIWLEGDGELFIYLEGIVSDVTQYYSRSSLGVLTPRNEPRAVNPADLWTGTVGVGTTAPSVYLMYAGLGTAV